MSLFSTAPFSNVTTYRKDFYKKTCDRPKKNYPVQEYQDPISEPLKEHILPNFRYVQLSPSQTKYPNPKEYALQVSEKYPSARIFLRDPPGGPPDLDVIDSFYQDENRTVYMVSYCERGDFDSKTKRRKIKEPLPKDWIVPLTTNKCSYRHPGKVSVKIEKNPPKDNLTPNLMVRKILEIKTGDSIYMSDIGNLGMEIIKGKLHGDINIRPTFNEDDLLKAKLIRTN